MSAAYQTFLLNVEKLGVRAFTCCGARAARFRTEPILILALLEPKPPKWEYSEAQLKYLEAVV